MTDPRTSVRARFIPVVLTFGLVAMALITVPARGAAPEPVRRSVADVEYLGSTTFPTGATVDGVEIGGISGLALDTATGEFVALSDNRESARFYTLDLSLDDGTLDPGDIVFTGVTGLERADGTPFPATTIDPEGIALSGNGTMFISSEGDANALIDPFVAEFTRDGRLVEHFPVPDGFLPTADSSSGIRNNLAFESLTLSPAGDTLITATESALHQDGPVATTDGGATARVLVYDQATGLPVAQHVYVTDPIPTPPDPPTGFADNGLVELLAIDDAGTLLAVERSFAQGVGNSIRLYESRASAAVDVSTIDALAGLEADPSLTKDLVLDLDDLGIPLDNVEAVAFGPDLPDGRRSLILASDNNFSDAQFTLFVALAIDFDETPMVTPRLETPALRDDPAEPTSARRGDADDSAIWVHPRNPNNSRIIGTLKDGGLEVYDLDGHIRQRVVPARAGDFAFNNVDVLYGFEMAGRTVDLAVVSDRANDTIAVFTIQGNGRLVDRTSPQVPASIFGADDGEHTAYGLTAYTSPVTGDHFVFVSQASGDQIAQLRLSDDGAKGVAADEVRRLTVPTEDAEDGQSEGLVVDAALGRLYVAMEDGLGILGFGAEPDAGPGFEVVYDADDGVLEPDLEGLAIYHGADGAGYLLASSQGDDTVAVFDRGAGNAYLGSFTVGGAGSVDSSEESDGIEVSNVSLGSRFPHGLMVVHDGNDDPQHTVLDDTEIENAASNFKAVGWDEVAASLDLVVDTRHDPRRGG